MAITPAGIPSGEVLGAVNVALVSAAPPAWAVSTQSSLAAVTQAPALAAKYNITGLTDQQVQAMQTQLLDSVFQGFLQIVDGFLMPNLTGQQQLAQWWASLSGDTAGVQAFITQITNDVNTLKAEAQRSWLNFQNMVNGLVGQIDSETAQLVTWLQLGLSTVTTDIINFITNAITGGNAPTSVNSPALPVLSALLQIPHTNVVIPPNPGTGTITHDAHSVPTQFNGTPTGSVTLGPWNHTSASTADYLVIRLWCYTNTATSTFTVTAAGTSVPVIVSEASAGNEFVVAIFAIPIPFPGSTIALEVQVTNLFGDVYLLYAAADSYNGVGSVSGTNQVSADSASLSIPQTSVANNYIVQAFGNLGSTLSSYAGSPNAATALYTALNISFNSGAQTFNLVEGDAAGATTETFTATGPVGGSWYAGVTANLVPNAAGILGSTFKVANISATAVAGSSGHNTFPTSFFNGPANPQSADVSWASGQATLLYAGSYVATIAVQFNGSFTSQWFGLDLYTGATPVLYEKGGQTYFGSGTSGTVHSHTFSFYAPAGTIISPGYYMSGGTGGIGVMIGDSTGVSTYFKIALANRSPF